MILSKVYEDAERRLKRNEITLGEFERLVDIEVIEPKRGEWEHFGGDEWRCTHCGDIAYTEGSWEHPLEVGKYYCENCGADMRGIKDE